MSKFETKVMEVEHSTNHPNADRLSIVKLKGYDYKIVSGKLDDGSHRYNAGDIVVYVQTDSIVPEYLLRQGFWNEEKGIGYLAGKLGNRVKAVRLRGITSEGILFPVIKKMSGNILENEAGEYSHCLKVGDDVSEFLGITKFEPTIPASMSGDLTYIGNENTLKYDIENAKKYPGILNSTNDDIYILEKLHGSFVGIGYLPEYEADDLFTLPDVKGSFVIFSKGLGAKGLVFKNTPQNKNNLYVRAAHQSKIFEKILDIAVHSGTVNEKIFVLGEVFGKGVQDLHYGLEKPEIRAFEINIDGNYIDADDKYSMMETVGLQSVPVLGVVGNEAEIIRYIDGESSFGFNIREGVVAVPARESRHPELGRILLKYVSDDYIHRKGATTEFQ